MVGARHAVPLLVDFSRASQLNLFDQPVKRVFQHAVKKKPAVGRTKASSLISREAHC
jgi:hypothetical protein